MRDIEPPKICFLDLQEYFDGLEPLEIQMLFHLGSFDDDEGGYSKIETLVNLSGRPQGEVEKALKTLMDRDLADYSEDLLDIEGEPWGAGYALFEDGERLISVYYALQEGEGAAARAWRAAKT